MTKQNILDKKYNFLKPIKTDKLVRLGQDADGGYVVDSKIIDNCNTLITFGLGSDWTFELDFIKRNKNSKIYIYDDTVSIWPYLNQIWKYLKRFLTFRSSLDAVKFRIKNYREYLKLFRLKNVKFYREKITYPIQYKKDADIKKAFSRIEKDTEVILKSDIESSEYHIIDQIVEYSNKIQMLVIEFHWIDKNEKSFSDSIKKLKKNFEIIHIHGNNHFPKSENGLPAVLEITLLNQKFLPNKLEYKNNFPIKGLDFPNNPYLKDLNFSFGD